MLVGDLIQSVREAVTDQPQVMVPPVLGAANAIAGGTIPAGQYFLVLTTTNPWGETLFSNEQSVTLTGGIQTIQFTYTPSPGSTGTLKLYIGSATGQENFWLPITDTTGTVTLTTLLPNFAGAPPSRNTAYLPDTDGDAISAYTMFRWINDALKLGSLVCGGLLDYGGVGSVVGAPQYIVPGTWKKISSMWYDGYPLSMDDNGNYFRRNAITASVLSSVAISTFNNQMMFELWPQPARSAAITTLSSPLVVGQLTANLTSTANFLLTNGFAKIGTEIVSYSGLAGNVLSNLQRALSGTAAALQPAGSIVQELNLFWSGWRDYAPNFQPGSSLQTVPVPVGWETILFEYGLSRMKLAEQNIGDYSKLNDSCKKNFSDWLRQNRVVVGPRQIGDQTSGLEVLPNLGGGWVVPALFPMVYLNEKCYDALIGGTSWHLFSFIACATLELGLFAMLAKRIIPRNGKLLTTLSQCWNTVEQKLSGFWNSAHLDSSQSFTSSKSVTKVIGPNVSGFGFTTTVGFGNFLTPDWAEKLFLHEQKRATLHRQSVCVVYHDAPKFWRKCLNLLKGTLSPRVQNIKLEKPIVSSFRTLKSEKGIGLQSKTGGPLSLLRSVRRALKEIGKRVGIGGQRRSKVKAPFYCQEMVCEGSGVIAKYALQGNKLKFIGWVNDGTWDYKPDEICDEDIRR